MADLGVDLSRLEQIFFPHMDVKIEFKKRRRMGFSGIMVHIKQYDPQKKRNLKEIIHLIKKLKINTNIKHKAIDAFNHLGKIEAEVHGVSPEDIHFHELGAVDAIVDIVGSFWALEQLEISRVYSSDIPLFEGIVECEHGKIPLPAPSTLKLLKGKPVYFSREKKELVTPTGALILDRIVDSFYERPCGELLNVGYGIGEYELSIPNILRGMIFIEENTCSDFQEEEICVLETNVDHLTGEEIGYLFDVLLKKGALDVFFLPGIMKKNRPSGILKVLCYEIALRDMLSAIFKNTLTLGIRINKVKRVKLKRSSSTYYTKHGRIDTKEFTLDNMSYKRAEFDSLKELGKKIDMSPVEMRLKLMEKGLNNKKD